MKRMDRMIWNLTRDQLPPLTNCIAVGCQELSDSRRRQFVIVSRRAPRRFRDERPIVTVQPGERHHLAWIDPREGIEWVIIKERSTPDGKIIVSEESQHP
jgi:hypothetical protein